MINTMTEPAQPEPLRVEVLGHVLLVTLNRPRRRNALDASLMAALRGLWTDADALAGIRCIVLTGADPGFCSGADMSLLSADRSAAPVRAREELSFLPGLQVSCPVVVAVNGVCAGAGLHFVADGDIVLASADASFLDPHVSVGQVCALEPLTLWLKARPQALMRMALLGTAERLTAEQALQAGLVSEVVPAADLTARALELANAIAANSPAAVAATRRALRTFEDDLLEEALDAGWAAIRAHWAHPDAQEGPRAFSEKRAPRWSPS
jgi:enoyl-CoA hydratase/carnithine racemase